MKYGNRLTYIQAALLGILTELLLVAIQLLFLALYVKVNPDTEFTFSSEYIKYRGFYIFQIIGFLLYSVVVFVLAGKMQNIVFGKILTYIIAGGMIELGFYLVIQADYEGAFLYSILDKFIAAAFGAIVLYYTKVNTKERMNTR